MGKESGTATIHLFADLATWRKVPAPERRHALGELAAVLGPPWRAGRVWVGQHGLGALVHDSLRLEFVVVPGGWLRMGLSADDLFALAGARSKADRVPWSYDVD